MLYLSYKKSSIMTSMLLGILLSVVACKTVKPPASTQDTSSLSFVYTDTYYLSLVADPRQRHVYEFMVCRIKGINVDENTCIPALVTESNNFPLFRFKHAQNSLPEQVRRQIAHLVVQAEESPQTKTISDGLFASGAGGIGATLLLDSKISQLALQEKETMDFLLKSGTSKAPLEPLKKRFAELMQREVFQAIKQVPVISAGPTPQTIEELFDYAYQHPDKFMDLLKRAKPSFLTEGTHFQSIEAYENFVSNVAANKHTIEAFNAQKKNLIPFLDQLKTIGAPHRALTGIRKGIARTRFGKTLAAIFSVVAIAGGTSLNVAGSGSYRVKSALGIEGHNPATHRIADQTSRTYFIPPVGTKAEHLAQEFQQFPVLMENWQALANPHVEQYVETIEPILASLVQSFSRQSEEFNFDPINRYCLPEYVGNRLQASCKTP